MLSAAPPAAWYAGENGDDLVGNNDGALQGNVQIVAGKVGNAFSFDGQSAVNAFKRSNVFDPGVGDFAYEAWIKFDGNNQTASGLIAFNYGGVPGQAFYVTGNDRLGFWARDNAGNLAEVNGTTALGDNQWHHVAAVRQGSTFSLFVDGSLDNTKTEPAVGSIVIGASYFRIGGGNSGPGHATSPTANESFYNGLIDELSYYPRALNQSEIQAIVTAGNAGKELPGPVAWYAGENGDDSVGNNNGALQGNVQIVAGKVDNAFSLDGQSAVNVFKQSNVFDPGAGDFSYEAWIKFDGTNQTASGLIAFNYGGVPGQAFYVTGTDKLGFWARDNAGNLAEVNGETVLGDNQWHHVAAVRHGSTFSLFVDGSLDGTETDPSVGSIVIGASYFRIGGGNSGAGHATSPTANESFFNGLIDELKYYPRARFAFSGDMVNHAPVLGPIGNKAVDEKNSIQFTVTATDPNDTPANSLTLSAVNLPQGATFNVNTGAFAWTPTESQGGSSYDVTFTVTDDGTPNLADSEIVTITVHEVNEAPVITSASAVSAAENQASVIDVQSSDADGEGEGGNGLTYSLTGGADQALFSIDTNTGELRFKANPDFEAPGDAGGNNIYNVQVTVTDAGSLTGVQDVSVTVANVNEAPVVKTPIDDVSANEDGPNDVIDLADVFDDVDTNDTLVLSVANSNLTLLTASVAGTTLTLDYLGDQSGTATVTVRATDAAGAFVEDVFTTTVLSAQDQVHNTISAVESLVASGVLNGGNGNALKAKLQSAVTKLNASKTIPAVNMLNAFINQVGVFVSNGKLTPQQGQPLIDAATAAINSASSGSGSALTADNGGDSDDTQPVKVAGELVTGAVLVFFEDSTGNLTADHTSRLNDAITSLNQTFGRYGVTLALTANADSAHIRVSVAPTSDCGGAAEGVLGCTATAGDITLISGWQWYAGANPGAFASPQFDFQTIVTHEVGHALGLDHSGDDNSVMHPVLAAGVARRQITAADLVLIDGDGGNDSLMAAGFAHLQDYVHARHDRQSPIVAPPDVQPTHLMELSRVPGWFWPSQTITSTDRLATHIGSRVLGKKTIECFAVGSTAVHVLDERTGEDTLHFEIPETLLVQRVGEQLPDKVTTAIEEADLLTILDDLIAGLGHNW